MNTILIVLGVLGLGAIAIAAYVFTVAARNYVSADQERQLHTKQPDPPNRPWVTRSNTDRRSGQPVQFPLNLHGTVIPADRRQQPDRRAA